MRRSDAHVLAQDVRTKVVQALARNALVLLAWGDASNWCAGWPPRRCLTMRASSHQNSLMRPIGVPSGAPVTNMPSLACLSPAFWGGNTRGGAGELPFVSERLPGGRAGCVTGASFRSRCDGVCAFFRIVGGGGAVCVRAGPFDSALRGVEYRHPSTWRYLWKRRACGCLSTWRFFQQCLAGDHGSCGVPSNSCAIWQVGGNRLGSFQVRKRHVTCLGWRLVLTQGSASFALQMGVAHPAF